MPSPNGNHILILLLWLSGNDRRWSTRVKAYPSWPQPSGACSDTWVWQLTFHKRARPFKPKFRELERAAPKTNRNLWPNVQTSLEKQEQQRQMVPPRKWQQCAQIFRRNVSETLGTFRRPKHWRGNSHNGLLALLCLEATGQVGTYIYKDPEAMRRDIGRPLQEPVDHVSLDMFCTNHALCSGQDFRQNTSEKNPAKHQRYNLVYSNALHISANLTNVSKFPPSASNFLCIVTNKSKSATRVLNDSKIVMWSCVCVLCMCVQHTVHNGTKCSLRHERKTHCLSFSSTPRFLLSIQNMVWSVWSKSELHCCYAAMLGNVAFGSVTFVFWNLGRGSAPKHPTASLWLP